MTAFLRAVLSLWGFDNMPLLLFLVFLGSILRPKYIIPKLFNYACYNFCYGQERRKTHDKRHTGDYYRRCNGDCRRYHRKQNDISELHADMRELRGLLISHTSGHSHSANVVGEVESE